MSTLSKKTLFDEFPPVTTKAWEEKIREDLKGADYEKKLVWQPPEGFPVQPYYRKEYLEKLIYINSLPGESPYLRSNHTNSNAWEIHQDIQVKNIEEAKQQAKFLIGHGVTSLGFIFNPKEKTTFPKNQLAFSQLLSDIPIDKVSVNFNCGQKSPDILRMLIEAVKNRKTDKKSVRGSLNFDPLGRLTSSGNFYENEDDDFNTLNQLLQSADHALPYFRVLTVNGNVFHEAGASAIQELGYSLAMASEYLSRLSDSGTEIDTLCRHLQFNLGIGSNYFMEIAKLRAARYLWAKIIEAYKPQQSDSGKMFIHSITSERNQTVYDPYMNLLRSTTESMSSIMGGTDSLLVRPFNQACKTANGFSERMARNIQIILSEEAFLSKVIDPGAGSYYIENLTDSIITETWKLFLQIESEGGYLQSLKKGIIQSEIETSSRRQAERVAARKEVLVGTNQYPNFHEKAQAETDEKIAFPEADSFETQVTPLKKYRASIPFEKLRLAAEKHPHRPKVFLLTWGDVSMRRARAMFATNFFACAGYEIIDNPGFASIKEGLQAVLASKADIVVFCSSDPEYPQLLTEDINRVKAIPVVAGAPACLEELKNAGIGHFIHLRSNLLESLTQFHAQLNIDYE